MAGRGKGPARWSGKRSVPALEVTPKPDPEPDMTVDLPPNVEPAATDTAVALAAEHGIDLSTVTGTGKDGRVTAFDVQTLVED